MTLGMVRTMKNENSEQGVGNMLVQFISLSSCVTGCPQPLRPLLMDRCNAYLIFLVLQKNTKTPEFLLLIINFLSPKSFMLHILSLGMKA